MIKIIFEDLLHMFCYLLTSQLLAATGSRFLACKQRWQRRM